MIGYSKQKSTTPMIFLRPKLHFVSLTVCTLEQYLTNGSENKVVLFIDSSAVAYYNICSPGQLHDQIRQTCLHGIDYVLFKCYISFHFVMTSALNFTLYTFHRIKWIGDCLV